MNRQNPRTNGQSKAIQTKSHTETYTLTKREKGKNIYIYHCSQRSPPQFGMIRCLFSYYTHAGYIKLIVVISSAAPEAVGRNFPFSSLFAQLLGFSFGFGPVCECRSPDGVCSSLRQDGVKGAADSGALAHSGRGEGGVRMRGEPEAAEAGVTLQQPEARRAFSRGSCPQITGAWQWRAAQAPGRGGMESGLCSHTGFLVAAAAALLSHARLCGPR